jgi:hypothetical protein
MIQEEIVDRLRDQFRRGATPSKLIRTIREMHRGEVPNPCVIQDYLEAAFHVPLIPCLRSGDDYSADRTLRHAALNRVLLPELVAQLQTWNSPTGVEARLHGSWLDGLQAISPEEARATAQALPHHGISDEGWAMLSEPDKDAIHVMIASSQVVSSRVQILAKLAECLQQQVDELQGQLASEGK